MSAEQYRKDGRAGRERRGCQSGSRTQSTRGGVATVCAPREIPTDRPRPRDAKRKPKRAPETRTQNTQPQNGGAFRDAFAAALQPRQGPLAVAEWQRAPVHSLPLLDEHGWPVGRPSVRVPVQAAGLSWVGRLGTRDSWGAPGCGLPPVAHPAARGQTRPLVRHHRLRELRAAAPAQPRVSGRHRLRGSARRPGVGLPNATWGWKTVGERLPVLGLAQPARGRRRRPPTLAAPASGPRATGRAPSSTLRTGRLETGAAGPRRPRRAGNGKDPAQPPLVGPVVVLVFSVSVGLDHASAPSGLESSSTRRAPQSLSAATPLAATSFGSSSLSSSSSSHRGRRAARGMFSSKRGDRRLRAAARTAARPGGARERRRSGRGRRAIDRLKINRPGSGRHGRAGGRAHRTTPPLQWDCGRPRVGTAIEPALPPARRAARVASPADGSPTATARR